MQNLQCSTSPTARPVAESAGGSGGGGSNVATGASGPSLAPAYVKLDRPMRFDGKHAELENFLFAMESYILSSEIQGQAATKFLVSYLEGDALTWWRQYCLINGGLAQVHSKININYLMNELRAQFQDINKHMSIR